MDHTLSVKYGVIYSHAIPEPARDKIPELVMKKRAWGGVTQALS